MANPAHAQHDYSAAPSPAFVLDAGSLRANLKALAELAQQSGATIICALKGFATYSAFELVREYLPGVTASSLSEARLGAEEFGGEGAEVHAYCPAYIDADFDALAKLASHISFNSLTEFERYAARLGGASAGLRVNPEYAEVETDLYNPCIPGSRLGVTAAQLSAEGLAAGLPPGVQGLHMHTLCEKGVDTLERTLEHLEAKFAAQLKQVKWLNLGGGHAITREGYEHAGLVACIKGLYARYPKLERIVLEPGSAVGWQAGVLVATVLDIVQNGEVRTAMLDVSFAAHMPDTLEMPYRPDVVGDLGPDAAGHRYHLGGQTCLAGDFKADYVFAEPLNVGQRLIFADMAHYTTVKTTTFNGVNLPALALRDESGKIEVLKRFGYADYKRRL